MIHRSAALALSLLLASAAIAQTTPPPATPPAPEPQTPPQQRQIRLDDLQPAQRLGARAELVRRGWPTLRHVVVVPDEASYLAAISAWTIRARFPVLIDDGTLQSREDAARFIRAFKPTNVWRFALPKDQAAWPGDRQARQAAIERAYFAIVNHPLPGETGAKPVSDQKSLLARWTASGYAPPGIVIADPDDTAWPAALALAAGRLQPIAWIAAPQGVNGSLDEPQFTALDQAVRAAAEATELPFSRIGDVIDAITLCAGVPVRAQFSAQQIFATTDLLARNPAAKREQGERWAWTGQIFGSSAQSAYRAMSALFLGIESAWLFDGYPDNPPWKDYDCTAAANLLKQGKLDVTVEDTPRQSARQWRLRTTQGLSASLIAVTTKGNADEFNLEPGQCRPGDVPFLNIPSVVYFVHSFSAAAPDARYTVAGRWLERGAYAYLGSVYEPFLQSFVPTPTLAARLISAFPWAAACRPDTGPAWRLTVLGDPLICVGPPASPASDDLQTKGPPIEGLVDVAAEVKSAVTSKNWPAAMAALALLGRDEDAARLAAAIMKDDPKGFTPDVAVLAASPMFRARRTDELLKSLSSLPRSHASDPILRDLLWHAAYTTYPDSADITLLSALRAAIRDEQPGQDAADLAPAMARATNVESALAMLEDAKAKSVAEYDKKRIEEARQRLQGRGR